MLRIADENVAKKSRVMMLLISAWLVEPVTQWKFIIMYL